MYIVYLHDRKKFGFSCIKDVRAAKQISDLKNCIKRTTRILVAYIVKKGKQLFIIIFSKEVLIAVFIFVKSISINVDSYVYRPSSEVYQCCISESNNLEFKESLKSFKSPSLILDSILKLNGGYNDLNETEMEKLVNSIVAKSHKSLDKEISLNKFLKKILKLIDPVISNQRFWRLISESQKPMSGPSEVQSTDLAQNALDKKAKTGLKGSSIFADALSNSQARRKSSSLPTMMAQTLNEDRVFQMD
jgi:hypothetical protein